MSYTVEPFYHPGISGGYARPYVVKVNGRILMTAQHNYRRFKDSKTAAIAGAKEVDRRRREGQL